MYLEATTLSSFFLLRDEMSDKVLFSSMLRYKLRELRVKKLVICVIVKYVKITPVYMDTNPIHLPTFVINEISPKPIQNIVLNVNQNEFSKDEII